MWKCEKGKAITLSNCFKAEPNGFCEQQKKETRTDADRRGWTQSRAMKTVWLNGPTSLKMSAKQIDPSTWNGKGREGETGCKRENQFTGSTHNASNNWHRFLLHPDAVLAKTIQIIYQSSLDG